MAKRLLAFSLALLLSISLISCGGTGESSGTASSSLTSKEVSKMVSNDTSKESSIEISDETSDEISNETSEEASTTDETSKETSAETSKETSDAAPKDTIPPAFIGATSGKLTKITHNQNETVDLLKDVVARDNVTKDKDVVVKIIDYSGYNKSTPGNYTITIQAEDKAGNKATVKRDVSVISTSVQKTVITIGNDVQYSYNEVDALSYTASGTKFRSSDVLQVMTKEFFVSEYNKHSATHTNNAKVPYFPNGVLVLLDKDMNIVQVRIAAGATIQLDSAGKLKSSELTWTNGIDADNGGGMFKGLMSELDTILPKGGYLVFVGNTAPEACRKFLISKLFYSGYTGGAVTVDNKDIDISKLKFELKK